MDINKLNFYSTDGKQRCDLILFEQDTIAIKLESAISNPSYPVVSISYNPTISTNTLFIQLPEHHLIINGIDVKLELINSQISDDNAQCTYVWKEISKADYWENEFWNTFFSEDGTPIFEIDLTTESALLFPNFTDRDGGKITILRQTGETYGVIADYTTYTDEDNETVSASFAHTTFKQRNLYAVKNSDWTHSNINGYWDDSTYNTFSSDDTLTLYDYKETSSTEESDPIDIPYKLDMRFKNYINIQNICQYNQFTYRKNFSQVEEPFVETIPDMATNFAKPLFFDFTINDDYSVLVPVQLLPVNVWGGLANENSGYNQSDPAYSTKFYVIPLVKEYNVYTRKRFVANLPHRFVIDDYNREFLYNIDYKITKEPLPYYQSGMDPEQCLYNIEEIAGNWTTVVNPNVDANLSDIIADIIHIDSLSLKENSTNKLTLLTKFNATVVDKTMYEFKSDDLKVNEKFNGYLEQEGFALISKTGTDSNYVSLPFGYNCGPQIRCNYEPGNHIHHYETVYYNFKMTDGHSASSTGANLKLGFKNLQNYSDYKQNFEYLPNTEFYHFEGYTTTILNDEISDNSQTIVPTQVEYYGNTYSIVSIEQFNLRTGYISGICYKKFD